jgi:DNA mismatch repair protein MutS
MPDPRDTPAMRQYARFKQRHPDCVLFFRMGDFYECFDDDAVLAHKALGLTLTKRTEGVPMAGMPYHQIDTYARRLIAQGHRVAIADQVQDPKDAKGIVERAVTRVLTPGTLVDESLLDVAAPSTIAAIAPVDLRAAIAGTPVMLGVAIAEFSTGSLTVLECEASRLADELASRGVRELLHAEVSKGTPVPPAIEHVARTLSISCTPRPAWHFRRVEALQAVLEHYKVKTTHGFGLRDDDLCVVATGALLRYLRETQLPSDDSGGGANLGSSRAAIIARRPTLAHLRPPRREDPKGFCVLDAVSLRALEVERVLRAREPASRDDAPAHGDGSLAGLFLGRHGCVTPMGKRLVREWLCRPLADLDAINARHRCVGALLDDRTLAGALNDAIDGVQDVSRIAARIALGRATPRDLVALGKSLDRLDTITRVLEGSPAFTEAREELRGVREALAPVALSILTRCVESPPAHMREGGLFKDGCDAELDEARTLQHDAGAWLAQYQARLLAEHALPGLKVGFNSVFGYYIELTSAQARVAPPVFARKQTLKNAERYTTPELKEFENKVTTAQSRAIARELALFDALCAHAAGALEAMTRYAERVATLDVLLCFARHAHRKGWTRPEMTAHPTLLIDQGRHPVLEEVLADRFVPNDLALSMPGTHASLAIITGPNMAGKSTFIRQTALIVLLAHAGSFVPANRATIGLTDRIFTRVGADDALHSGQSTFMVEMTETATILNAATPRSLVILDEIGRGTSTLDGLSLAWAITEHLATPPESSRAQSESGAPTESDGSSGASPRTLFATHYHELTELEELMPGRVRNLHVAVREWGEEIVFLHHILPGRASQSYGVHVAKLAGIPPRVIERAREVLGALSVEHSGRTKSPSPASDPSTIQASSRSAPPTNARLARGAPDARADAAPSLFDSPAAPAHPAIQQLREIKLEALSPLDAFDALRKLREMTRE